MESHKLSQQVESYRFWAIVSLWAKELGEHEEVVARALAKGVIREGLVLNSIDQNNYTAKEVEELRQTPYVGYCSEQGGEVIILRTEVLEHLLDIVNHAKYPSHDIIDVEFFTKDNFSKWLIRTGNPLPHFWFSK